MCTDWEIMNQGVLLLRRIVTLEAKVVTEVKEKKMYAYLNALKYALLIVLLSGTVC